MWPRVVTKDVTSIHTLAHPRLKFLIPLTGRDARLLRDPLVASSSNLDSRALQHLRLPDAAIQLNLRNLCRQILAQW